MAFTLVSSPLQGWKFCGSFEQPRLLDGPRMLAAATPPILAMVLQAREFERNGSRSVGRLGTRPGCVVEADDVSVSKSSTPSVGSARRGVVERRHGIRASRIAGGLGALLVSPVAAVALLTITGATVLAPAAATHIAIVFVVAVVAGPCEERARFSSHQVK